MAGWAAFATRVGTMSTSWVLPPCDNDVYEKEKKRNNGRLIHLKKMYNSKLPISSMLDYSYLLKLITCWIIYWCVIHWKKCYMWKGFCSKELVRVRVAIIIHLILYPLGSYDAICINELGQHCFRQLFDARKTTSQCWSIIIWISRNKMKWNLNDNNNNKNF